MSTGDIVQACVVLLWMPQAVRKSESGLKSQCAVLEPKEAYIRAFAEQKKTVSAKSSPQKSRLIKMV
jgi:hypothetical protein